MYTEMYDEYMKRGCMKLAESVASEITSALAFYDEVPPMDVINHAVSVFSDCLREKMIVDMNKYGRNL